MLERLMLKKTDEIEPCHYERYKFAATFAKNLQPPGIIVDAACGCGYGSNILKSVSPRSQITGYDYSEEALSWARENYEGIEFIQRDLNKDYNSFSPINDLIVSFETIEHLDNPIYTTLEGFVGGLRKGGILCFSHPLDEPVRDFRTYKGFHKQFALKRSETLQWVEKSGLGLLKEFVQRGRWGNHFVVACQKCD